ncbi:MAG: hypothetical protein MZV63_34720 [Marinilabiliales bacterium]|nr:hypothetical protein [Marinilabiliales bacterium]
MTCLKQKQNWHQVFIIEYSGPPYAMIKLAKYIMLFILPAFLDRTPDERIEPQGINILWAHTESPRRCAAADTYQEHQPESKDKAGDQASS